MDAMSARPSRAVDRPRRSGSEGRVRALLAAALALAFFVTGAAWSFSSPPGSSPDDDHHLASIWCPHPIENSGCPLVRNAGGAVVGVQVPEELVHSACYAFNGKASGACELAFSETTLANTDRVDRGGYPGGFFIVLHAFVGPSVDATVLTIRLVNAAIASLLVGLLVWTAPRGSGARVGTAFLVTFTPLGLFLVGSTNPSAWAIVGVPGFYFALQALLTDERPRFRWLHAGLAVVSAGLACAARSDAAVYVVLLAGLVVLRNAKGLAGVRDLLATLRWWLVVPAVGVLFAVLAMLQGRQASVAAATEGASPQGRALAEVLITNVLAFPSLIGGFSGLSSGLGWLDTTMPATASYPPLLAAAALVFVGLGRASWRKLVAMALLAAALVAIPMYILLMQRQYVGEWVQPRYLLPLWTVLVGVALLGARGEKPPARPDAVQAAVLFGGLAVAQAVALYTNTRRYVTGLDGPYLFAKVQEWWWSMPGSLEGRGLLGALAWTPMAWIVLGALAFAAACVAVPLLARAEEPAASE